MGLKEINSNGNIIINSIKSVFMIISIYIRNKKQNRKLKQDKINDWHKMSKHCKKKITIQYKYILDQHSNTNKDANQQQQQQFLMDLEEDKQKYIRGSSYLNFFMAMAVTATTGYIGLLIFVPSWVLLKQFFTMCQLDGSRLDQKQKQYVQSGKTVLCGAIFGSLTGFILLPLLCILAIKVLDGRIQINKKSLYTENIDGIQTAIAFIAAGLALGHLANFVNISLFNLILHLAAIYAVFFVFIVRIDSYYNINRSFKIVEMRQRKLACQFIQNLFLGFLLVSYTFLHVNFWICILYIGWMLISNTVYQKFGFKFQQNQNLRDNEQLNNNIQNIKERLLCPITSQLIKDPYFMKQCGHTFEKASIEAWLSSHDGCPLCNTRSVSKQLGENKVIKELLVCMNDYLH